MGVLPTAVAVALILGLAGGPVLAQSQQAGRVHRIGVLDDSSADAASARIESFRKGLRDLGRIEGQNVKIESRFAEGKEAALSTLATELAGLKPDVLVASTGAGLAALHNATTAIPIVAAGADAETRDVTPQNLARPGGNITGVISSEREADGKRMELLHEAVPAIARVATFWDCNSRNIAGCRSGVAVKSRVERWGFTFVPIQVWGPDDFEVAFASSIKEGARALSLSNTALFYTHRRRLAELAVKNRLAWIAGDRAYAEAGCLMSYGPDAKDLVRRAASYVDRILRGAKPADLPIEQPTRLELVVNLKTAKALGLTIPRTVLARADELIR
jgi:putative ABC transport system substrate-binding protein